MKQVAKDLLSIKAVTLSPEEPFTWASGIKSPIYCDNRLTISYPEVRKRIAKGIADIIRKNIQKQKLLQELQLLVFLMLHGLLKN